MISRGDARMKVHVLMGVDVVERQAGCAEGFELRPDLGRELTANPRKHEKSDTGAGHISVELAVVADELLDLDLRQNGMPVDQVQVQADAEFGQSTGAGHRIGSRRAADHQARG